LPADRDDSASDLDQAAYVLASKYRQSVVESLKQSPTTPTEIADQNSVQISHISRALGELREKELVQSHSGGSRTKLYTLTDNGEVVADLLDELEKGDEE
jgi:predicted transcriptional regulator